MVNTIKLKELRIQKGYTLAEVARHLGFASHQAYMLKEQGLRTISADELGKLAQLYDVPITDLYTDVDEPTAPSPDNGTLEGTDGCGKEGLHE